MKLIVGLGNPGSEYQKTRHNIGFMVVDALLKKLNIISLKEDFFGAYIKTKIQNEDFIIYKPYTFMNDSGRGVISIVNFFKIDLDDILVIHDDLDLPNGLVRLRKDGSSGGHNGIKSVIANLNSEKFKRLRIGIEKDPNIPVIDYVLGKFNKEQEEQIKIAISHSVEAICAWASNDFDVVMSKYNKK